MTDIHEAIETRALSELLQGHGLGDHITESTDYDALDRLAGKHGVQALLYETLNGSRSTALQKLADRLSRNAFYQAALFSLQHQELQRMLTALNRNDVPYLLIKGAALAYQIYTDPHLRPRCDIDILIEESSYDGITGALSQLGYQTVIAHDGGLVSHQRSVAYTDKCGVRHIVDIHWRISNRHQYRDILSYGSLIGSAVKVPELPPGAMSPDYVHSLCLACLHLVGHHADNPRLIWLYDMYRLLQHLDEDQIGEFLDLVRSLQLEIVTCQALTELVRHFVGTSGSQILSALGHPDGLSMPVDSRLDLLKSDLDTFPTLVAKCQYLASLSFPHRDYIRKHYQLKSDLLIPWFYMHRVVTGIADMLSKRR